MTERHISQVKILILVAIVAILFGSMGFMVLEKLSFTDALLRVLLLFSTLGFGEVTTQTTIGKWYTIVLIMVGLGVIVYATSTIFRAMLEGEIRGSWKQKMTQTKLHHLKNHVIICGFGRVGRQVAEEIMAEDIPVVVIDRDNKAQECEELGYVFIEGDPAASDEIFEKAGIHTAKTLIIAIGSDSECLAAAVTARALDADIFIVARATSKQAEARLMRVGVNRVALPAYIGGFHMATMALRPSVVDFLDLLIDSKRDELQIEEYVVDENSNLIGQKVQDHFGGGKRGVTALAIMRSNNKNFVRPTGATVIEAKDRLILLGTTDQLDQKMDSIKDRHAS